MLKTNVIVVCCAISLSACDADEAFEGADPSALTGPVGKADGPEYSVVDAGVYDLVRLQGGAASDLFDAMDRAGGLSRFSSGGLDYVYGYYSICVSNGSAAACNIYSRQVEKEIDGFSFTVHGPRFDSAASELFGTLARAQGVSPSAVVQAESSRFVCAKDTSDVWCGLRAPVSDDATLELSFAGLPALGDEFVYEGWLITADGPVTSGRFVVTDETDVVRSSIDRDLADASDMFVLTIEPKFGDDPAPSDTHVVAGAFVDGEAVLTLDHPAALGDDFRASTGGFILETPSTAGVAEDFDQGVWFLDPSAGPGASLELPRLPAGWAYEGWVVGTQGPISTGRFVDPAAADSDGAGPTAGPDGSPPFPGQDFINPPMDLTGLTVVLSVEPDPDDSPAPFALKPLAGEVAAAGAGALQSLGNIAADNEISGLAVLQ